MRSRCVNQNCSRPLASFSEGRLFQFKIVSISVSADEDEKTDFDEVPNRQTSHFWLSGSCSATMRLALEPTQGLQLISLEDSMSQSMGQSPGEVFCEPPCELHQS